MPEANTTLPTPQGSTPAIPPAASIPPVILGTTQPASAPIATSSIAPPVDGTNAPDTSLDFSAFEAARDLSDSAKAGQTASTLPGSTPSPAPTTAVVAPAVPAATLPVVPTPTSTTTPAAPLKSSLVDDKGAPIPAEISLGDSLILGGQPKPLSASQPANTPAAAEVENGRDMTGFSPDEKKIFRHMSNDAFATLAPQYRESKTLKQQLATQQAEAQTLKTQLETKQTQAQDPVAAINPLGYALTPEYLQIAQTRNNLQIEAQHWQSQLAALLQGKKPKALTRDNQGNYFEGQEMAPDAQTQAWIQSNLIKSQQYMTQTEQQEQQFRGTYQARVTQDIQALQQAEDKYFPWFAKGQPLATQYEPVIKGIVQQLPPSQRNHPLAIWVGKAYALIQDLNGQLTRARASAPAATAVQLQNPVGATSPAPTASGNGGSVGGNPADDLMAAYNQVLRG